MELPEPSNPGANYVPYRITGNLLYLTGQLCHWNGEKLFIGKLGTEYDIEEGQKAAQICGLNLISQLKLVLDGDLGRDRTLEYATNPVNTYTRCWVQCIVIFSSRCKLLVIYPQSSMLYK